MYPLRPRHNIKNYVSDNQEKCLRSFLLKLIKNNNITKILAQREIGGNTGKKPYNYGVNYRNNYNFKQRRFIIFGKDCFTQMWKVADIVYTFLCDNGMIDHKECSQDKSSNNTITPHKPSVKFIRHYCNLFNIKDQIHIIERNQSLDNLDIERINKCFILMIIDYSDEYSRDIRGNREYIRETHGITLRNPRVNSIISDERNWRGQTGQTPFQEIVLPEILTIYNSEENREVSVLHKNICYVSAQKVLHHKSWIDISDYD